MPTSRKEFSDRVFSFFTHPAGVVVKFHGRDASYLLLHERADFVDLVARLASLWRTQAPARVVVEPTLEIVSVAAVEAAAG